jgi:L-asparagine transporter-like permease
MHNGDDLHRGLEERHVSLMALGAAIGVGLFLGSATAIRLAGPAILISYIVCGLAIFIIMRALGEMAIVNPVAGSFSRYAHDHIGPLAGYLTGWTYWFMWIVTCMAEITAVGVYMHVWYLPIGSNGGNLFFQLVNACYERCAIVLTSNRSFGEWGEVFGDTVVAAALLDRLLHHAIVVQIEGSSYRLREHADLLPDHLRNRPSALNPAPVEPANRRPGRPRKSSTDPFSG